MAVPLSTWELLEEKKYDQICPLILVIKANNPNEGFDKGDDEILHC